MSNVDILMDKHTKEIETLKTKLLDDFSYYFEVASSAQVLLIAAEQALATLFEEHSQNLNKVGDLLEVFQCFEVFQCSALGSDKPKLSNWEKFCEEQPAYPGCKDFDL